MFLARIFHWMYLEQCDITSVLPASMLLFHLEWELLNTLSLTVKLIRRYASRRINIYSNMFYP